MSSNSGRPQWISEFRRVVIGIDPNAGWSAVAGGLLGKGDVQVSIPRICASDYCQAVLTHAPVVIEQPASQGLRRAMSKALPAVQQETDLWIRSLRGKAHEIYLVPWNELARVVGYSARRDGLFDSFLNGTLKAWGYGTGRKTALNSEHLRSAFLAALWLPWALVSGTDYADKFKAVTP